MSFPVPRLHTSRPAQGHRGGEGRDQKAAIHATA